MHRCFAFYAWQKIVVRASEAEIWSEIYFWPGWQLLFDVPNSIPVALLAALIAWRLELARTTAFFASVVVHCLGDLALHHDDAHRHFLPLSDWRFASPVSYWDPAHFGCVRWRSRSTGPAHRSGRFWPGATRADARSGCCERSLCCTSRSGSPAGCSGPEVHRTRTRNPDQEPGPGPRTRNPDQEPGTRTRNPDLEPGSKGRSQSSAK